MSGPAVREALVAALLVAAVCAVWPLLAGRRRAGRVRRRLAAVLPAAGGVPPGKGRPGVVARLRALRRWRGSGRRVPAGHVRAAGAGAGTALLVGGLVGAVLGLAVGVAVFVRERGRSAEAGRAEEAAVAERIRRQLPLAADLLAACLAAGAGPGQAAAAVGGSIGGPLGERLVRVAAELRLGGDPARCWARFGAVPGAAVLGRRMERACGSGAPPVRPVEALAAQCRAETAREAHARARRAGVLATAPLGLCFLPAFLLVGVVPLVIGLTGTMLTHN
ncbi:hypothetical protein GCM10027168_02170 [Streptomyces capparidis]